MTRKLVKEAVRIVCPHCRRTYVIKVDLKRIYRTKPRAVCSRCGGKFEVVQRMYEIEENLGESTATNRARRRRRTKRQDPRRETRRPPRKKDSRVKVVEVETVTRKAARLAAEVPLPKSRKSASKTRKPPVAAQDETAPPRSVKDHDVGASSSDSFATTPPEPPWPTSTAPPAPATTPLWVSLESGTSSSTIRAPQPEDLDSPMPWLSDAAENLESINISLPESAETLIWLLTERGSRPGGASPPPVPEDAGRPNPSTPSPEVVEIIENET